MGSVHIPVPDPAGFDGLLFPKNVRAFPLRRADQEFRIALFGRNLIDRDKATQRMPVSRANTHLHYLNGALDHPFVKRLANGGALVKG